MAELLIGRKPISEILKHKKEALFKVYVAKNCADYSLLEDLRRENIPCHIVDKEYLTKMIKSESHQGFIAEVKQRKHVDLPSFLKSVKERSLVLALDNINDPQNLGALLRSAECFQVDGVVWSKNRGADLTPIAAKASMGASELLKLIKVSNLSYAMDSFDKAGYEIIAANISERSVSVYEHRFPPKMVLILGSEEEGIQEVILKKAFISVHIPMLGLLESLNVSQAGSIILSEIRHRATLAQA